MEKPIVLRSQAFAVSCVAGGLTVLLVNLGVILGNEDVGVAPAVVLLGIGLGSSMGFFWAAWRLRMELDEDGIKFFRLTFTDFVQWSDVVDVYADYDGLNVVVDGGDTLVRSGSLGKTNVSTWLGVRTAADDRVANIQRELLDHQDDGQN